MKLWELRRASENPAHGSSDAPSLIGVVVRAESEAEAREFARRESHDEHGYIWLDEEMTTCIEFDEALADGNAGVVLAQWTGSTSAPPGQGTN